MNKFTKYLELMVTAHSGISSKRVCGVLGFLVIMFSITYCTATNTQAPTILETFIWAVCTLLGIDSVTGIWKNNQKVNNITE